VGEKKKVLDTSRLPMEKVSGKYRNYFHRDYIAHMLRWSFALRYIKRDSKVLDVGCGDGQLADILYRNRRKPEIFVGIDINKNHLKIFRERKLNFSPEIIEMDIREKAIQYPENYFDVIACFEVIEHFEKRYVYFTLGEIRRVLKNNGILLLSTPNYNEKNKAKAHIHEYKEKELEEILIRYFNIEEKFGTFASTFRSDFKSKLSECEKEMFDRLKRYYDSTVLSIMFAPLHPSESRNILWVLKKRNDRYQKIMEYVNNQNQLKNLTEDEKNKVYDFILSLSGSEFNTFYKKYILPNKSFI